MAVPVMDNCCTCDGDPPGCFRVKQANAGKVWTGVLPFATYSVGNQSDSTTTPSLNKDGNGNYSVSHGPLLMTRPTVPLQDRNEQEVYLTETEVIHMVGHYAYSTADHHYFPVTVTTVLKRDKRDGTEVFKSIDISPSPIPTMVDGCYVDDIPYIGIGSGSWELKDDGTIVRTGDPYWLTMSIPNPGGGGFQAQSGIEGYLVSWTQEVTRTSCATTSVNWIWKANTDNGYEEFTISSVYTLSDRYSVQDAFTDVQAMLATASWSYPGLLDHMMLLIAWNRPYYDGVFGPIALSYTLDGFYIDAYASLRVVGSNVEARKSRIKDVCTVRVICGAMATGQELMEPSTVETPYNGNGVQAGNTATNETIYSAGGTYEMGPSVIETVCGDTYGYALPYGCS